ncbi:CRIB domain-containing protein RIC10-like [Macadamia integrifolia]|uniref:CRIB domain-containing protein RIC10-like n=1 Tax=Macadamia integrifolia TaxID=60698 RepID=UPI001C4FDC5F|nr:CRIB domain-containing protein RIC10-like [Macadamia integrifolia]XP_042497212.1 CRIB domain-containing protein RIC10-like [Macadamia integrifolia]
MAAKMKGLYKGFKCISQIFVVKEQREMEIGYPTDVKHVAHIGWDNQSANAPTWMNEFKCSSDFSAMSLGSIGGETDPSYVPISSWSSQDFDQSMVRQPSSEMFNDAAPKDLPKAPKKHKRKKTKSASSPRSTSSSRSSRVSKPSFGTTVAQVEIAPSHQGLLH